jgi:cation diffusion facilitator CzcD-associated flavoprotein CzcO
MCHQVTPADGSQTTDDQTYEAIVVGAGPGGLACIVATLDAGVRRVLWVDKDFQGGRLNTYYREISS